MTMRTHGASDDDDEEQGCDDTCDAVKNDHGDSGGRRRTQRVLLVLIGTASVVAPFISPLDLNEVLHMRR
jgi:hypothetical protein